MAGDQQGLFGIGVVARLTGLHEQTIRQYERLGLVTPQRSEGGTRLFSESDLQRLNAIASLTRDLGVNLAGVDIILQLRERQARMIALAREMFSLLDEHARQHFETLFRGDEPGLVPAPKGGLAVPQPEPGRRRIKIGDGDKPKP